MKLRKAVSWLMGTLQRNLFPHLEEIAARPLTDKEQQLVNILEILQIETMVSGPAPSLWGRKPHGRQDIARAFVAKAVYNLPTTRATVEALRASPVLRRLCGFVTLSDIPSEATFSRAFGEFAQQGLGERVHAVLVAAYAQPELVGHISRDATAIRGREKPAWRVRAGKRRRRPWRSCRCTAMWASRRTPKAISKPGAAINCTWMSMTAACPSAWRSPRPRCATARRPSR